MLLRRHQLLVLRGGGRRRLFSLGDRDGAGLELLFLAVDGRRPLGERRLAPAELVFGVGQLLGFFTSQAFGFSAQLVRLFFGFEQRFLLARFRVAFGVL